MCAVLRKKAVFCMKKGSSAALGITEVRKNDAICAAQFNAG